MQNIGIAAVYHPRRPQQSPLWKMLNDHYHDFELNYDEVLRTPARLSQPRGQRSCR